MKLKASIISALVVLQGLCTSALADSGTHFAGQLRSKHLLHGVPKYRDSRHEITVDGKTQDGISILVREGFVVGHFDKNKVPAWVSMRWNEEDFDEGLECLNRRDHLPRTRSYLSMRRLERCMSSKHLAWTVGTWLATRIIKRGGLTIPKRVA